MDLCACGHTDNAHQENTLLGTVEGCKSCKCKKFEWAGSTSPEWDPDVDEDWGAIWSPERDKEGGEGEFAS